jgi:tRNA(fMet)-specific endonuclease VapC
VKYLLDTNAVIAIMKGDTKMIAHLKRHTPVDFGMPTIVLHELMYRAYKSEYVEKNVARVEALQFERVDFDHADAEEAARIRAHLAIKGKPIGPYDALIAGQARARALTVITNNTKEFKRVPSLSVEDWLK